MRRLSILAIGGFMLLSSCQAILDAAIDCATEAALLNLEAQEDISNSRRYIFTLDYSGNKVIEEITYVFGDGNSQTTTSTQVSHTYTMAREYSVVARIDLKQGNGTCSLEETLEIEVN